MNYYNRKKKRSARKTTAYRKRRYILRNAKVNHLICKRYKENQYGVNGSDILSASTSSVTFKLNDLINSTEFTSLFDQYMITGIQYRFRIQRDPSVNSSTGAVNQGVFPRVFWVHDHDDSSAPATQSDLYQYPKMREMQFTANRDTTKWFYLKPAVATQIYGPVNVGYNAKWRTWLDCGYPGTPHYGIKLAYNNLYSGVQLYMDCKFILKFKSVI